MSTKEKAAERVVLTAQEEATLIRRYREGDPNSGARLVQSCRGLVIAIARPHHRAGSDLEDLIQQGNLGLLSALERFDPERGVRFGTYAAPWVRGEVRQYATRLSRSVRLGSTHSERTALRLASRGMRDPDQLSAHTGMPLARARALVGLLSQPEVRLDAPSDDGYGPHERLASTAPTPEQRLQAEERNVVLRRVVDGALDSRERHIVQARYLDDEPSTLNALSAALGVSSERVRQLEVRALARLREALMPIGSWTNLL